jgi:hypothetical protein
MHNDYHASETEKPDHFRVGQRVELHPACDLWMRGATHGNVCKIGRRWVHVQMDKFRRPVRVSPRLLIDRS